MRDDCIWCRIYKQDRDQARDRLARALKGEEHILVQKLRNEIRVMQKALEDRNRQLDAMHWVWCDGGCETGVHRFDGKGPEAITQEVVNAAIRNTERLKRWFSAWQYRQEIRKQSDGGRGGAAEARQE